MIGWINSIGQHNNQEEVVALGLRNYNSLVYMQQMQYNNQKVHDATDITVARRIQEQHKYSH